MFAPPSRRSTLQLGGNFSSEGDQWIGNTFSTGSGNINLNILRPLPSKSDLNIPRSLNSVPFRRDQNFIDRPHAFNQIEAEVSHGRPAMICDLGGTGKSQIAIEYGYRFQKQYPESYVLWIFAMNGESIVQSYHDIARRLRLPGLDLPGVDPCQLVADWLCSGDDESNTEQDPKVWLVILDNLDSISTLEQGLLNAEKATGQEDGAKRTKTLMDYLPTQLSRTHQLVVTTRTEDVVAAINDSNVGIEPGRFTEHEALTLLSSRLSGAQHDESPNEATAKLLVQRLDHIPLAITQAAGYMVRNRTSLSQYLAALSEDDKRQGQRLSAELQDPRRARGWPNSVFQTWKLSFETLRTNQPGTTDLLSIMSLLDVQQIQRELLEGIGFVQVDTALGTLFGYSLASSHSASGPISIHPLVASSVRYWLREQTGRFERSAALALALVSNKIGIGQTGGWPTHHLQYRALVPHIEAVIAQHRSAGLPHQERTVLRFQSMGFELTDSRFSSVLESARSLYQELEQAGGLLTEESLECQVIAAAAFSGLGNISQAVDALIETLDDFKNVVAADNEHIQAARFALIDLMTSLGRFSEAEQVCADLIKSLHRPTPDHDRQLVLAVIGLADLLNAQGKFTEAEPHARSALEACELSYSEDLCQTSQASATLARSLRGQSRHEEAVTLCEQALALSIQFMPQLNIGIVIYQMELARTYDCSGQNDKAIPLMQQAVANYKEIASLDTPGFTQARLFLAMMYSTGGRSYEAISLLREIMNDSSEASEVDSALLAEVRSVLNDEESKVKHREQGKFLS